MDTAQKNFYGQEIPRESEVKICIGNEAQIYNQFTGTKNFGNNLKINDAVISYLYDEVDNIPIKSKITIKILAGSDLFDKIKIIEKLIKDKILTRIIILNKKIIKSNRNAVVLALAGMFSIGSTQIFQIKNRRFSLNEFIIVMSWVFMWKAVEIFFFEKMKIKKEKNNLMRLYEADYQFENDVTASEQGGEMQNK